MLLSFCLIFANFGLALLTKVLLIKKGVSFQNQSWKISQNSQENIETYLQPHQTSLKEGAFLQIQKQILTQVNSCEFCEIFKDSFYYRTTPVAQSMNIWHDPWYTSECKGKILWRNFSERLFYGTSLFCNTIASIWSFHACSSSVEHIWIWNRTYFCCTSTSLITWWALFRQ